MQGNRDEHLATECRIDCAYKENRVNNTDGSLNDYETLKVLSDLLNIWDENIIDNIHRTCWESFQENLNKIEEGHICSDATLLFGFCSEDMIILHCDAQYRKKEDKCEKYLQELKQKYE
ncbi:hypothetical protein L9F63_017264 [Diploptera punctata]|uniref:Uncharacterized protein n=1 Tax=Diploptera punctata TaxID=6984 RepID=A0AAD7ZZW9_DIPPU|nr:hypothetical protein L9F63_017264 [Diploptera punctata]